MHISLYSYLGILLLSISNIKYSITIEEKCSNILSYRYQEGEDVIGTIFEYALPYVCFACTRKPSRLGKDSVIEIPLYNNLLDFGFSGVHFPPQFTMEVRMTEECSLVLSVESDKKLNMISYNIEFCVMSPNRECFSTNYSDFTSFEFGNWNCLSIALAFIETNQIHIGISSRCQNLASAKFSENSPIVINIEKCVVDINNNDLHASIKIQLERDSKYDGFPVILPCSPGGYAVDPFTGRFLIDHQCYRHFPKVSLNREEDGINFIIKKVYKDNENLLFPRKIRKPYDVQPKYIKENGEYYSKEEMKSVSQKNMLKGNRSRIDCNYEKQEQSSEIIPCEDLLNYKGKPPNNSVVYYVHRNGCFICSEPKCDFNDPECKRYSVIKNFPAYNNVLGFGIPAVDFPQELNITTKINEKCHYMIKINRTDQKVEMGLYECLTISNNCTRMGPNFPFLINFNNYYCIHLSLVFRTRNMVHMTISDLCNKFATTEYVPSHFNIVKNEYCHFFQKNYKFISEFKFLHANSSTYTGIPLLVPCSTGGVAVSPITGRFISGPSCRKMLWEASARDKGLTFIIEEFYKKNEDYLFLTEKDTNVKYPSPVYRRKDKSFISHEEAIPKIVPNKEAKNKTRKGCYFIDESSTDENEPVGPLIPNVFLKTTEEPIQPIRRATTKILPREKENEESTAGYVNSDFVLVLLLSFILIL